MAQTCDYLIEGLKLDIEMSVCADSQKYNSKEDRLVVL